MKSLFVVFAMLTAVAAQAAEKKPKWLLEDCKFVSLNNTIRMAYASGATRVSLSPKSQEGPKSATGEKFQIIVLDTFAKTSTVASEFAVRFELVDPENGFCRLKNDSADSIKVLAADEVKTLAVPPQDSDAKPGQIGRLLSPCNRDVVSQALADWSKTKTTAPLLQYNSLRTEDSKNNRQYDVNLSEGNTALIVVNPKDRVAGVLGPNGLTIKKATVDGPNGTCTIK